MSISVNAIASKQHSKLLEEMVKGKYAGFVPLTGPWHSLSPELRRDLSRGVREILDAIRDSGCMITFIDEYAIPGPGDDRWIDPVETNHAKN